MNIRAFQFFFIMNKKNRPPSKTTEPLRMNYLKYIKIFQGINILCQGPYNCPNENKNIKINVKEN